MPTERKAAASPLVSVLTPVYQARADHLRACIGSLLEQTDADWQLVLVDDASHDPATTRFLEKTSEDPRVVLRTRTTNGGIVAATNDALALATGQFVAFLDQDDVLAPHAVATLRTYAMQNPTAEIFYSDRGHIDDAGARARSDFTKPAWSPERLRGNMYMAHLTVVDRAAATALGGMRPGFDGAQDHDLVLRISERGRPVVRIPEVLYSWRAWEGSTAANPAAKPHARNAGLLAVTEHCQRLGIAASPSMSPVPGFYWLNRYPPSGTDVSIIIPTGGARRIVRGTSRCLVVEAIRSVVNHDYLADYELIIVHDVDIAPTYLDAMLEAGRGRVRLIAYDEPFNFSRKINIGALQSRGSVLVLLNDDVEVISPNWLDHMTGLALEPDVGAVGAKLLYEDDTVQHAGICVVPPAGVTNAGQGNPDGGGYFGSLLIDHEVSAVTAACLAVKKSLFLELGGFSEEFAGSFNDVDFCFKAAAAGYRNISANSIRLYHFESLTRDPKVTVYEHATLLGRWRHLLKADRFSGRAAFHYRKGREARQAGGPFDVLPTGP